MEVLDDIGRRYKINMQVNSEITLQVFEVDDRPIMELVLDVMSLLGRQKKIAIVGKGKSISNAVTVALIITEKMMRDSKIDKITVDSEPIHEMGGVQSTIEIILKTK